MAAKKKKAGKKGKSADLIISKARTKNAVKKCNVGGEFYGALDAVVRELDTLPGVQSVAAANFLPFDNKSIRTYVDIEGLADSTFCDRPIDYRAVSANYFRTMGLPRAAGPTVPKLG